MDTVKVDSGHLNAAQDSLNMAYNKFKEEFDGLKKCIGDLTTKEGLTGDAANTLMKAFQTKVEPKLDAIEKQTSAVLGKVDDNTEGFAKLNNKLDGIFNA